MQTSNHFCEKLKVESFNFSQMFMFILTDLKFEIHSVMRIDHWPVLLQYIFILKIEITFFLSPPEKYRGENETFAGLLLFPIHYNQQQRKKE